MLHCTTTPIISIIDRKVNNASPLNSTQNFNESSWNRNGTNRRTEQNTRPGLSLGRANQINKPGVAHLSCIPKAEWVYSFFRVKKMPMTAPIRIIGATLTNSHSNE